MLEVGDGGGEGRLESMSPANETCGRRIGIESKGERMRSLDVVAETQEGSFSLFSSSHSKPSVCFRSVDGHCGDELQLVGVISSLTAKGKLGELLASSSDE